MDIKRPLEVEGPPLLKCEPPPPLPLKGPSPKRNVFESFKQFLEFSILFKNVISCHASDIQMHFLSRRRPRDFKFI